MEHVASPAQATPISHAEALKPYNWRAEVYAAASPTLRSKIADVDRADRAYRKERLAAQEKREVLPSCAIPSDDDVRAAIDAVPAPEILRVPIVFKQLASVAFTDGSTVAFEPREYHVLKEEEIEERFANDSARLEEARSAWAEYETARQKAIRDTFAASRTPAYEAAQKEYARWERRVLFPACNAREKARQALCDFDAESPIDRLAQAMALFEREGGKIGRTGRVLDAEDAFEGRDGRRLAQILFDGLWAAVKIPPTLIGSEAVCTHFDLTVAHHPGTPDNTAAALVAEYERLGGKVVAHLEHGELAGVQVVNARPEDPRQHQRADAILGIINTDTTLRPALTRYLIASGRAVERFPQADDDTLAAAQPQNLIAAE